MTRLRDDAWARSPAGRPPAPRWLAWLLLPLLALWTLPQTLTGLVLACWWRTRGAGAALYRFGPFLFLVVPVPGPMSAGISLGVVVLARHPAILKHEFCHLFTGLWLSWLYLPVYGVEYLILGHARSPHERLTCWLERRVSWGWQVIGRPPRPVPPAG